MDLLDLDLLSLAILKKASGSRLVDETVTGNPVSFTTDVKKALRGLTVPFTFTQSGSGNASPTNVRPITGYTGISIAHSGADMNQPVVYRFNMPATGKNLFNKATGIELTANNIRVVRNSNKGVPFRLKAGITYVISTNSSTYPNEIAIQVPYQGIAIETAYTRTTGRMVYTPQEDLEVAINVYWTNGRPEDATDIQIEIGTEKSPYVPYDNTAYYGYLDVINGELVLTYYGFDMLYTSFLRYGGTDGITSFVMRYDDNNIPKPKPYATVSNRFSRFNPTTDSGYISCGADTAVFFKIDTSLLETDDVAGILKWFGENPTVFVHELAEPIRIPVGSLAQETLVGENNIWSDTNGIITVTYLKKVE